MADKELAAELEEFEAELGKDDDGEDLVEEKEVDLSDDQKEVEDPAETGQEADPVTEEEPVETVETEEAPEQDDKPAPKLTTLPDDKDAFGELAGKEVTAEQLIEANLLEKIVTWGHQGRHLIKKGQDDIEAAKAETSEAQKLRELLQERFKHEDQVAEDAKPQVTEEQYSTLLTDNYLPGLKGIADAGGIEQDFLKEFPKVATHIEHRFQAGSEVLTELVDDIKELRDHMGLQKAANEKAEKADASTAASGHFDGLMESLAEKGDLFEKLGEQETKDDFVKWISSEETGLRIAEKEITSITPNDLMATWLLYVQQNPEKFAKKAAPSKEDAQLASGGGGRGSSKSKSAVPADEFSDFEAKYKQSLSEVEY